MKQRLLLLVLMPVYAVAQPSLLTLQHAVEKALQHYPLVKQKDLLKQTAGLTVENLNRNFLPQVSFNGLATYQSEVTSISIPVPGISITPPSKDQYKLLADVNQLLYDGGMTREQKNFQQLNEAAEQQKVEVELYKVKERINQLFLGVLYLDEQLKQVELVKADLNTGLKKTTAMVNNGVAFRSNISLLKAEILKADQRTIELKAARKGMLDVMALFTGEEYNENTVPEKPIPANTAAATIQRPELQLFGAQQRLFSSQYKLIDAKNRPKASVFWQGGYGRPGLNFLKNDFAFFYTTGLRLNWSFGSLYTQKREKQLTGISLKNIDIQKESFLLNTNAALKQQQSEIDKLEQLIEKDAAIIELRDQVKEAAKAQLENGVITANDYLREVNAADQGRQSLITHQVQLLQAKINYQTISGN
ncbi:MAG: TolC family protein [Ferruginibacter sp.]